MECCYADCGEYAVVPMLVSPCSPVKCCDDAPECLPCLPRCIKKPMCCYEKPAPRAPPRTPASCAPSERECCRYECIPRCHTPCTTKKNSKESCSAPPDCEAPCYPSCRPVKTKYVIPCYRYEDGRITNQPTVLMRRACEVAVGKRPRRKPYVESSYIADSDHQEHRYICEDERGNSCYHFEKKNLSCVDCCPFPRGRCLPCTACRSSPECQYVDCVGARMACPTYGCYYC